MIRKLLGALLERTFAVTQYLRNSRDLLDQREPAEIARWGFTLAGHKAMAQVTFEREEAALVRVLLQEDDCSWMWGQCRLFQETRAPFLSPATLKLS